MMRILSAAIFLAACHAAAAANEKVLAEKVSAPDATFVEGVDGWRFLPAEIRHLLAGDPAVHPSNPLAAIGDFHRQLQALGIRLILVPVPAKAAIHPEKLDARLTPMATEEAAYAALRKQGLEVIDLAAIFRGKAGPFYCERDSHWNGKGIELAAEAIAASVKDLAPATTGFDSRAGNSEIQGDLGGGPETVALQFVQQKDTAERMTPDRASPVLLLGDSHLLVFHEGGDMHAAGAGLPDQVARLLGTPVDVLGVRGSGATTARVSLARRARSDPDYLKSKKAVVWCFTARDLTQAAAWKPVPLLPAPQP